MSNVSEKEQQAIEYAKNYPHVIVDTPMMGPFSVGNVTPYNDRVIINLCVRTARSHPKNATISYPKDWARASQFKPGDQVNVQIEKGLVKRIWQAKAESVKTVKSISAAAVNEEVGKSMEEIEAEMSIEDFEAEMAKEESEADKSVADLIKEAVELVPQEAGTDDLPF